MPTNFQHSFNVTDSAVNMSSLNIPLHLECITTLHCATFLTHSGQRPATFCDTLYFDSAMLVKSWQERGMSCDMYLLVDFDEKLCFSSVNNSSLARSSSWILTQNDSLSKSFGFTWHYMQTVSLRTSMTQCSLCVRYAKILLMYSGLYLFIIYLLLNRTQSTSKKNTNTDTKRHRNTDTHKKKKNQK